jgi:hypothetical protein
MAYIPEFPYTGRQILIDSGRVTLNAKDDSVFLIGREAVGLSTDGAVHINSGGDFYVNSSKIYFGLKTEESNHEPIVLGDKLATTLNNLAVSLGNIAEELKEATDSQGAKLGKVQKAGELLAGTSIQLNEAIKSLLSDKTFTL